MGCFNDNKLQSVNQEEGKIGPRASETLIYQQAENSTSYHILHTDGDNCVYGLMKMEGDLNNAGGVEAHSTTSLDVEVSINPSADYTDLDNLPTTFIDPTCKPTRPPNTPPWVVIPCPEISTTVNVGSIKARYITVHDSDMTSVIVDNGLTYIKQSRLKSTTIDSELLIFIINSKIQDQCQMDCKYAMVISSDVDSSISATCLSFFFGNGTIKGEIETPELVLFGFVLDSDVTVNIFKCYDSVVNGNIDIIAPSNNQSDCIDIRSVGTGGRNSRLYYNYQCVSNIFLDQNGRQYCIKNKSASPGPLVGAANEMIFYLNQYDTEIQRFYASISFYPQQNYTISLIKTFFSGDLTNQSDEDILAIDVTFAKGNINVRKIVSPPRNSAASNVYDVKIIQETKFKCLSLDNIEIGEGCAAEIVYATTIKNLGKLEYLGDYLEDFIHDGVNAESNFASNIVRLGRGTTRINNGTLTFNRIVFGYYNHDVINCTIEGDRIVSDARLTFSGCTVEIKEYEQTNSAGYMNLVLEDATVFDAGVIHAPIVVNVGCILLMTNDYNHDYIENYGIINGSKITTWIKNYRDAIIKADTIECLPMSELPKDSILVGQSVTCTEAANQISCNIDADFITIFNSIVGTDASLTGNVVLLANTLFAGNAVDSTEVNFDQFALLDGGTVSNANFFKDSGFVDGIMYNGTMQPGSSIGSKAGSKVAISGNLEMNGALIDGSVDILNQSNISINGCSAVGSSLQDEIQQITLKVFAGNILEEQITELSNDTPAIDAAKIQYGCNNPTSSFTCLQESVGISAVDVSDSRLNMDFDVGSLNVNKSELLGCIISVRDIAVSETYISDCEIYALSFRLDEDSELFSSIVGIGNSFSIKCPTANCTITSLQGTLNYEGTVQFPLDFSALSFDDTGSSLQSNNTTVNGSSLQQTTITGPAVINDSYLQGCTLSQCEVNNSIIRNLSPLTDLDSCVFNNCTFL